MLKGCLSQKFQCWFNNQKSVSVIHYTSQKNHVIKSIHTEKHLTKSNHIVDLKKRKPTGK